MARSEHQGLQIALIIFVMLVIVLGVTTYLFFRKSVEADKKAKDAATALSNEQTERESAQADKRVLLTWIGLGEDIDMERANTLVESDFLTYGKDLPEQQRNYRTLLQNRQSVLAQREQSLKAEEDRVNALLAKDQKREEVKQAAIKPHNDSYLAAKQGYDAAQGRVDTWIQSVNEKLTKIEGDWKAADQRNQTELAQAEGAVEELKKEITEWKKRYNDAKDTVNELQDESFDVPDGKITSVSQASQSVYINLGRADYLQPQTEFGVYPADLPNLPEPTGEETAGKPSSAAEQRKGTIEVVEVLSDHLSRARIMDSEVSNPILPGDQIYTPLWKPGERLKIALTPWIDVDNDAKSDMDEIIRLVMTSGAEVAAYLDDRGNMHGELTADVRYLVTGRRPTGHAAEVLNEKITAMEREAVRLRIREMPLHELLARIGYRRPATQATPGAETGSGEFPARPRPKQPARSLY